MHIMKRFRVPHFIIMAFIFFIVPYAYAQEITYLSIGGEVILLPHDAAACVRENVSPRLWFPESYCSYNSSSPTNVTVNGLNFLNTTIEGSIFPSAAPEGTIYLDISYKDIEGIVPVGFTGIGYTHGSIAFKGIPFKFIGRYEGSYAYQRHMNDDSVLPYISSLSFTYNTCTASSPDNSSSNNYVSGTVHIKYNQATLCPAESVLGTDSINLENLRYFRDSKLAKSAIGRKAIQIYYNNADSINSALERSPALRAFIKRVLEVIAPMVGRN
jgi:hypothetical protein